MRPRRNKKQMRGKYFYSVKDLSKRQNLTIAYYLYMICSEIEEIRYCDECQKLYNLLVIEFNLQERSKKIIDCIINHHIKTKKFTPREVPAKYVHPFELREKLTVNYKEDEKIFNNCGNWASNTENDINIIRAIFTDNKEWFPRIIAYTFFYKKEISSVIDCESEIIIPETVRNNKYETSYVNFLINDFKLTDVEGKILNIAYLSAAVKELNLLFADCINRNDDNAISLLAKCSGLSIKKIRSFFRTEKKLVAYGLMGKDGVITEEAVESIYDGKTTSLFENVLKTDDKKYYPLNSFSVKEDEIELASRLLTNDSSMNLLFYGAPGAGKTQFARSLVHSLNLKPLVFKNELEIDDKDSEEKALCKLNSLLSLYKKDTVIIVDEAEGVLKTQGSFFGMSYSLPQKGIVNKMLEESTNKVIWILNYTNELDESTRRRFTYAIKFNEMSRNMLKSIADSKLNKIKMSSNLHSELVELCGKYHVTGASVDNIVKTVSGMNLSTSNEKQVVNDVKKVLESNSTLIFGKKKMRENVRSTYDLSVLNTSMPVENIVEMIINAQEYAEENGKEDNGIRMLFYGLSGTGKTELARYIAETLGKKIILKRPSDILGKYVGENEENIKKAFEQAEATGDILLFDEADTFFADRSNLDKTWERSTVNEFLTQMEEFSGILICTTNLRQIMDPAMQRRFHILTEFKPLQKQGIEILLSKYFSKYSFNSDLIGTISKYDTVTPGDFGTLSGKFRFINKENLNPDMIISELCKIQEEKDSNHRSIGFAG